MILESYLLYQEYKKRKLAQKKENKEIIFVANGDNESSSNSSGVGVLIFLVILFIVSIAIAIACAYFLYSCIRNQCMGFLIFVLVVILLNVPFINIAIFFILLFWWLMKCRKPGQCRSN
jgi:ABC-type phosphate transport system permease subunit